MLLKNSSFILFAKLGIGVNEPFFASVCIHHGFSCSESFGTDQEENLLRVDAFKSSNLVNRINIGKESELSIFGGLNAIVLGSKGFVNKFYSKIATANTNHDNSGKIFSSKTFEMRSTNGF